MKRTARNVFAFIITLLMITALPAVALATNVSVTTDSTEVKAGDTVTLTVVVTADHIGVASGSFTYDPALLTYVSSDGGASDGYINMVSAQEGGSSSLSAVITFTAKAEGTAAVNVSIDSVLSYDEQALETGEGEVSITIAAADVSVQPGSEESVSAVDLSQTGVAAQNVTDVEEQMYVWRDLSSLTLPSGFADTQVTYAGEEVGGAAIPDSDDIILLYLSEAAGGNAGYYIYNEQNDTLDPYITITSKLASFSIVWPDQTVTAPEGFEETTLEWNDQSLPAWKTTESGDIVYLVYARNSKGETGFYIFNTEDESVQRYAAVPEQGTAPTESVTAASEPATESTEKSVSAQTAEIDSGITIGRTLFIGLCIAVVLILAAAIVFAALYIRCTRSKLRRVMRLKERVEAESKDRQASPVLSPAKEQTSAEAQMQIPPQIKDGQETKKLEISENHLSKTSSVPPVKEQKEPAETQPPLATKAKDERESATPDIDERESATPDIKDRHLSIPPVTPAEEEKTPAETQPPLAPKIKGEQETKTPEIKEELVKEIPPVPQAKEQNASEAAQTPLPPKKKGNQAAAGPETKRKRTPLVKDADLSNYPKSKDT